MKIAVIVFGVLVTTAMAVYNETKGSSAETFKVPESNSNISAGGIDAGSILKNIEIGSVMKNVDLRAMGDMFKGVDRQRMMNDIMKNVDQNGIMNNMDVGAIENIMRNADIGSIIKNVDLSKMGAMNNIDEDDTMSVLTDIDLPKMADEEKENIPDTDALMNMKNIVWAFLEKEGIPVNDPKEFINFVYDKLDSLPLPNNLDADTLLNMAHGELKALGFPEDPTEVKDWLMEQAELVGINDIEDLKKPEVLSQVIVKKAFGMMGIDENEDPYKVMDRVQEQLIEEANKLGGSLTKDSTTEEIMAEMDNVLSKHVNEMFGIDTESVHPVSLCNAAIKKLHKLGVSVHNIGAMKKHVIDLAMKELMQSVPPMLVNLFLGGRQHFQPRPMMQPLPLTPSMFRVEPVLHYSKIEEMNDLELYHHIMDVRQSLMAGEMPKDLLQEMIENLKHARWRNRVLTVKNMFLRDRIISLEHDLFMIAQTRMSELPEQRFISEHVNMRKVEFNEHSQASKASTNSQESEEESKEPRKFRDSSESAEVRHEHKHLKDSNRFTNYKGFRDSAKRREAKASMNSQESEEESKEPREFRDSSESAEVRHEHKHLKDSKKLTLYKGFRDSAKRREGHKRRSRKRHRLLHSLLSNSRTL